MLDRFIFGESVDGEREFVIHTFEPILIFQLVENEGYDELKLVNSPLVSPDDLDPSLLARIAREAADAWQAYCENLGDE